jgi:hypothetical protein
MTDIVSKVVDYLVQWSTPEFPESWTSEPTRHRLLIDALRDAVRLASLQQHSGTLSVDLVSRITTMKEHQLRLDLARMNAFAHGFYRKYRIVQETRMTVHVVSIQ